VVVRDFDREGMGLLPSETDAILLIDPDAVLVVPITAEPFQPVAGRHGELPELSDAVDLVQLSPGNGPQ
jgi:hypothetical protein